MMPKYFDELACIVSSKLIPLEAIKDSVARLLAFNKPVTKSAVLADLVDEGLISLWQARQIQQGKFKGFFLFPYRLLKLTKYGERGFIAEAVNTLTGRFSLLWGQEINGKTRIKFLNALSDPSSNSANQSPILKAMRRFVNQNYPKLSEDARLMKKQSE